MYSIIRTVVALLLFSLIAVTSHAEDARIAFSVKINTEMPEGKGAIRNSEGVFEYPEGTILLGQVTELKLSEVGQAPTVKQALDGNAPKENVIGSVKFEARLIKNMGAGSVFFIDEFNICFVMIKAINGQFICDNKAGALEGKAAKDVTFWRWVSKNTSDATQAIKYTSTSNSGSLLKYIALIPNQEADRFIDAVKKTGVVADSLVSSARDIRAHLKALVDFQAH